MRKIKFLRLPDHRVAKTFNSETAQKEDYLYSNWD